MKVKMSRLLKFFFLGIFFLGGLNGLRAFPLENVTSDNELYQRVKKLGDAGLLDSQDKAVLDQGLVVTRLELALYTEKAQSRLDQASSAPTSISVPAVMTPAQAPAVQAPNEPSEGSSADLSIVPEAPVPVLKETRPSMGAGVSQAPVSVYSGPYLSPDVSPTVKKEIVALRKEFRLETQYLRTRLSLDDKRVKEQEAELDHLNTVQDDVESAARKSNKSGGSPHLIYETDVRVEDLQISGPLATMNAMKLKNEMNLGFWADLGGKGSINLGLEGLIYDSNASAGPASIYLNSPSINYEFDGMLGKWNSTVAVEYYSSDTDLGDFTRGASTANQRFEDPFDIKKYSGDKNQKNWDDYITNLSYVPSYASWINSNNSQQVFDGLYMIGTQLPLLSKDAKATFLVGRVDRTASQKWEEALKYSQPWFDGHLQTGISTEWVNENYGVVPDSPTTLTPVMDQKTYAADIGIDLKPVFLDIEGGYSHFYTGLWTPSGGPATLAAGGVSLTNGTINPQALEAPAGQASVNIYPLTLYYTAISDTFINTQSKVILAGFNKAQYGYAVPGAAPYPDNQYGFIGMVDDLISDRYGWRANLGWKGRQENWMKDWPSFLDDIVVNLDLAQKTEYRVIPDELGYNVVEAYDLITAYYPEDLGLWGSAWGGYSGVNPVGKAYVQDIEDARKVGNATGNEDIFVATGATQRVPFILPVYASPGVIATKVSGGVTTNLYTPLDHLKTFNYITLTTKFQFNKMLGMSRPFYGDFFFTDHQVSGDTTTTTLSNLPDPNRPGQTLGHIPSLFDQTVYDTSFLYQLFPFLNVMADYGIELWKSNYTWPLVDYRTDSLGAGLAYDIPWGGSKLEVRYKHLTFQDAYVPASNYQADQVYTYFLMQF